jgi:RNA polymerase sigma factor (TIGR02999 family)
MEDLTMILKRADEGDAQAARRLVALLYDELRSLAQREMAGERRDHTLQPTALVHEAYLRLMTGEQPRFENRAHFFGAAAAAIRRVLVDHARSRGRLKRGGRRTRIELGASEPATPMPNEDLLALDEALLRLAEFAPIQARIVELRFFAGMTIPEVARALSVSETTVQRDWRVARAWLKGELAGGDGP